ncbi:MAG: hypothetical protein IJX37_07660 [Oscillospiraceae bacterium]|nr:hypothetical protein [Oscillospiraceae bacterium]
MKKAKTPTVEEINKKFEKAFDFKQQIGLYDTVQINEEFFVGKQWEGVQANGLPTPTFNFLKQVVNFQVATITSDNMAIQATPLTSVSPYAAKQVERITEVLNHQYAAILERNHFVSKLRQFMRNAAVDGDSCIYCYFDPTIENGQMVKGEIVTEIIENTRVHFGNPNCRDVQNQPHIILSRRELVDDVKYRAEQYRKAGVCGMNPDEITADSEKFCNKYDSYTDDKVTVLTYLYRNRESGTIWCVESTEKGILRKAYDTKYTLYPLVWLSWDYIQDCYHGQAMITGLIPNQKFINKMFAMVGISLMTTAFPKVIYDKNRIRNWDGAVGTAVGVAGNVDSVAKTIDGATVNPQIAQFINLAVDKSRSFLGASDVAMGDSRPDNTSAIIALQRAANTPMEMTKQNMYQCVEDLARIWQDMMSVRYGIRMVEVSMAMDEPGEQPLGMQLPHQSFIEPFDFAQLKNFPIAIKQDVGASSYWSEMANMQTLDNLLMNHQITLKQYLERIPNGYISKKQELIQEIKAMSATPPSGGAATGISKENINNVPVQAGPGNGQLQRLLNRQGA